jgi:hypothetical protein
MVTGSIRHAILRIPISSGKLEPSCMYYRRFVHQDTFTFTVLALLARRFSHALAALLFGILSINR